jgi:hypothetical protein
MADRCEGVVDLNVLTLVTLMFRCMLFAGIGGGGREAIELVRREDRIRGS